MSENFVAKFAQVNLRTDRYGDSELCSTESTKSYTDDDVNKANPWKPILSMEKNVLESDAWPEPSEAAAPGEHRRPSVNRLPEEKPKRKIKWQNYDVDQLGASGNFPRGRGRASYNAHNYPLAVNPLRRGGFRGRTLNDNRGARANGYYSKYSSRFPNVRTSFDSKDHSSINSDDNPSCIGCKNITYEHEYHPRGTIRTSPDYLDHTDEKSCHSSSTEIIQPSTSILDSHECNQNSQSHGFATIKRNRERPLIPGCAQSNHDNGTSGGYEAGPLGRARRSGIRQHPVTFTPDLDTLSSHGLVTATPMQPVIPLQPVAPLTYLIPGATGISGTLWGAGLQFAQSASSHPSPVNPIAGMPTAPSHFRSTPPTIPVSPTGDNRQAQENDVPTSHTSSTIFARSHESSAHKNAVADVNTEIVDVNQMIAFIDDVGWNKVVFPNHLRNHPAIAAVLAAKDVNRIESEFCQSSHEPPDSHTGAQNTKPEDVVVVENRVFFVPRNVNKTKFLKFTSKIEYIKHHVEYYFSEPNLNRDAHLISILELNQNVCPIVDLLLFNRLKWVSTTDYELLEAVSDSPLLSVTFTADGLPFGIRRSVDPHPDQSSHLTKPSHENEGELMMSAVIGSDKPDSGSHLRMETTNYTEPITDGVSSSVDHHAYSAVNGSAAETIVSTPVTSVSLANNHPLSFGGTNNLPAHILPSAMMLSSVPRVDLPNVPSGSVSFATVSFSHVSPYTPQGDISAPQPLVFSQPPFCTSQHGAVLTNPSGNHPAFVTTPVNPGHPSTDIPPAFVPAFYRIAAPGHPPPSLNPYIPQISTNPNFNPPANSAVLLQFLPAPHAGGFAQLSAPVYNRAVGSLNSGGLWIPFTPTVNGASQPITSSSHGYQTVFSLAPNATTIPVAAPTTNAQLIPPMAQYSIPNLFAQHPLQPAELLHSGQNLDKKSDVSYQNHVARQSLRSSNNPTVVDRNLIPIPYNSLLTRCSTATPFVSDSISTTVSQPPVSSHSSTKN